VKRDIRRHKMIETENMVYENVFERHEDHTYIEGLFYDQIESLTRGCRR